MYGNVPLTKLSKLDTEITLIPSYLVKPIECNGGSCQTFELHLSSSVSILTEWNDCFGDEHTRTQQDIDCLSERFKTLPVIRTTLNCAESLSYTCFSVWPSISRLPKILAWPASTRGYSGLEATSLRRYLSLANFTILSWLASSTYFPSTFAENVSLWFWKDLVWIKWKLFHGQKLHEQFNQV